MLISRCVGIREEINHKEKEGRTRGLCVWVDDEQGSFYQYNKPALGLQKGMA
jgi:hypothetical protein